MKLLVAISLLAASEAIDAPKWGMDQFFARVEASYWAPGPGSLTITNTTGFLAHDATTGAVRLDQTTHMRALSSAASFLAPVSWFSVAPSSENATLVAQSVVGSAGGSTCFAMREPAPFPMVGSTIARWMDPAYQVGFRRPEMNNGGEKTPSFPSLPSLLTLFAASRLTCLLSAPSSARQSFWHSNTSTLLGQSTVRGEAVDVWGWDSNCIAIHADFPTCTFRAFVSVAAPRRLLREEYFQYGTPYGLNGTANFYEYENAADSFEYMAIHGLFDAPEVCASSSDRGSSRE